MTIKTTDLCDLFGEDVQIADPVFTHFGAIDRFHGKAVCVEVFEDNVLVRKALETDGRGRVLVVDGGGSLRCALMGDQMAQLAIGNHWSGIVIFGCIRDSKEIADMPIGLAALNTSPKKSGKQGTGSAGRTLRFASVTVRSGSYVYADRDGLIVSDKDLVNLPDLGAGTP